jgi:hypothetical protein
MPPPRTAAIYRARDGSEHDVLVLTTPAGRWRILDTTETTVVHVETLTGHDDLLSQATALARDYASEQQAYHDGERLEDPLPRLRPDAPPEDEPVQPQEPACAA